MSVATSATPHSPTAERDADSSPPGAVPTVSPWKRRLIWAVLFVIVGGHLVEVVTQREHWPFSPYQMWSIPSTGMEVNREMLRGVTDEPTPREIPIAQGQLNPIPYQMVVVNMQSAVSAIRKGDQKLADRLIAGLLEHYNNRVASGKNPGPKLKSLRLYQVTWLMDHDASQQSKDNPIRTTLVYPLLSDDQRAAATPPVATRLVSEYGDDDGTD